MAGILIIDDDEALRELLAAIVVRLGHEPREAATFAEGLTLAEKSGCDVVLLDMFLPDGDGLDLLPRLLARPDPPEILVITGRGDADSAEKAIKTGAWDYIQKPAGIGEYTAHIKRVLDYRTQKAAQGDAPPFLREGIVGDGPKIRACLDLASRAASTDMNVLIQGETGTGKELFARAMHLNSPRKSGPFVIVDCAAIPETLVESVLFGHEKGAFTSADKSRTGLIKQADTGTLFLDEVGELPPEMQKSFLRVLQERSFRPLGGGEIQSDFRLLAATNRDLEDMAARGRFRQDLLYRLRSFTLELPSLRDRIEDIPALAQHGLGVLARRHGIPPRELSPEFCRALQCYRWPGNVRELFNALEQTLFAHGDTPVLHPRHLPTHIRIEAVKASIPGQGQATGPERLDSDFGQAFPSLAQYRDQALSQAEESYLRRLITHVSGDMKKAMAISGLSASRFYALLRKHGIRKHF